MIAFQITEVKDFMRHLLMEDTFDDFDLIEAVIVKDYTVTLDGRNENTVVSYAELRELLHAHVRGKTGPRMMRLTLSISPKKLQELTEEESLEQTKITSFILNIRYEQKRLQCVSGVSFSTFSMEKPLEALWDRYLTAFFELHGIEVKEG